MHMSAALCAPPGDIEQQHSVVSAATIVRQLAARHSDALTIVGWKGKIDTATVAKTTPTKPVKMRSVDMSRSFRYSTSQIPHR